MNNKKGFSLVEIMIYFALVSMVLVAATTFTWNLIKEQEKQQSLSEVNENGSFVMDKIGHNIIRASDIGTDTKFDTNLGKLVLTFPNSSELAIDTYEKTINIGEGTATTTKLRYTQDGNSVDLTSDIVDVERFELIDFSNSNAHSVRIKLKIHRLNPSNSKIYEAEQSWQSSYTIRKRK